LFCVRSTDAGSSWSPAVRVNNDAIANGRDQFHFWMTVDDSGFVDVVFLDRRNDPNNILCDAYFAQSRDGGRSFRNFRITPQNFDPRITPNGEVRLGEYIGIDARRNRIVPSWVDTHLGNQDIYIAVIDQDSTATIRGRVSGYDALQVSGIALLLLHDNGIDSAFADSTGYYQFDGLFPGTYALRLQDGFVGTPDTVSISLASGETVADRDFHIISTGIAGDGNPTPRGYSLSPNYPNPFNSVTRISYSLPSASHVSLRIYDVLGRGIVTLVDERKTVGRHTVEWNAAGVPSGVYFYRLAADGFLETKEMVLSK
jgi:hypothetical protein